MSRLYLFSPRCVVRDATEALLSRSGYRTVGADGQAPVAAEELTTVRADLLLADLRWGCAPLAALLGLLPDSPPPRVLAWLNEHGEAEAQRLLPAGRIHAWLPAMSTSQHLRAALSAVAEGQRLPPPWDDDSHEGLPVLAPQDRLLLRESALGRGAADIAKTMGQTPRHVADHRRALMQRLGLRDLASLVRFAMRHGLIDGQA